MEGLGSALGTGGSDSPARSGSKRFLGPLVQTNPASCCGLKRGGMDLRCDPKHEFAARGFLRRAAKFLGRSDVSINGSMKVCFEFSH